MNQEQVACIVLTRFLSMKRAERTNERASELASERGRERERVRLGEQKKFAQSFTSMFAVRSLGALGKESNARQ